MGRVPARASADSKPLLRWNRHPRRWALVRFLADESVPRWFVRLLTIREVERSQLALLLLPLGALAVGCFASTAVEPSARQPLATLDLVSVSLGSQALAPTHCFSGERQVFLGADFVDDRRGLTARLIVEPTGAASTRVFATAHPLEHGVLFRRQDCDRFALSLERTGWRINDVYDLRVELDLDCRTSAGDSLRGTLRADHCH